MLETQTYPVADPFLSSFLEAPETKSRHQVDTAGRSIQLDSRTPILFRHSGWIRTRKCIAESLTRTKQPAHRTDSFHDCGHQAYVLQSVDDPSQYRIAGSCCKDRFCLPCATERSCIIAGNVVQLIQHKQIRFLTLTIKTTNEPLTQSLDKLYRSFQLLRRRAIWTRGVDGGVAFLELNWSARSERWHPHLHCLLEGRWIDQKRLASTWHAITGDSWIIDIRRPANNDTVARYVTKYASKPFNSTYIFEPALLDQAVFALHNRKLAVTFGSWRGLILTSTPDTGAWEHVAPLADVIQRAANGNQACQAILAALTDMDMSPIYARAPPLPERKPKPRPPPRQLDFFGVWNANGSFVYHLP